MCVELAHVFPSMGGRRLVTRLTYLAPLMVQSEKQALLPCSLYAFFLKFSFSQMLISGHLLSFTFSTLPLVFSTPPLHFFSHLHHFALEVLERCL